MFLFELSLALGFPHPRYLLEKLSSQEVTEWLQFYKIRPFGYVSQAHMMGTLVAMVANLFNSGRAKSWEDFFPVRLAVAQPASTISNEEAIKMFQAYNLSRGYKLNGR